MKKLLFVILICALHGCISNISIDAQTASMAERAFTRRFGAHSPLLQATSYFKPFKKKKKSKRKKR